MKLSPYQKFYETGKGKVEVCIRKALQNKQPASLYDPVRYIMDGSGKRIRPLLVLIAEKTLGSKILTGYHAGAAVEMLHNFTLVHDDIMDNAGLRRGKATLHTKYDSNTAILAGDSLLAIAYDELSRDLKINTGKIVNSFTRGLILVCEGQALDKDFELRSSVTLAEYIDMISKKTAAMMAMCCEVGGLLADGKPDEIKALYRFGLNIGIAFQIQDDLLDVMAEEAEFGKVIGGDLLEGKKTFLFLRALEKAGTKVKSRFTAAVKNKGIKKEEIEEYKGYYISLGVIEETEREIERYTRKALNELKKLSKKYDVSFLSETAQLLMKRKK